MNLDIDLSTAPYEDKAAVSMFHDLGVEPIINCNGVRTVYGGCNPTVPVLAATKTSSKAWYEQAEAIGRKLARLTAAKWGVVTAGSHAVAAWVAGNYAQKMLKLPLRGENVVVVAAEQRMAYEHALRAVGYTVTPIGRVSSLDAPRIESIAAICLVGLDIPASALPFEQIAERAKQLGIPLTVDGAALAPSVPNVWLRKRRRSAYPFGSEVYRRTAIYRNFAWLGKTMQSGLAKRAAWSFFGLNEGRQR
ncbi:hypothetical protein [Bradyrhizobium sp. 145]|uniref:hypothetical protein n=1 Tax=Bradyrhizobium sp. 145 TaxID=2782621 RepID=UPI001FF91A55|nr:hypothetical protein [Bradyrhizobium sp. 145]MCK1690215.1 hypothetical protein [Bradyrhizobium sp. 145]